VLELVRRCKEKLVAIGVDPSQVELEIERLVKTLEAAVREKWGS